LEALKRDKLKTKQGAMGRLDPLGLVLDIAIQNVMSADLSAFYTRSDVSGSGDTDGGSISALLAPVYKFNDRTFFILMYDGLYYEKREFYSDEIGSKERTEFTSHSITPMVRFDFGERARYSLTPSVFHSATYNKDVETDDWDAGLYNYRDYGGGLDFDMRQVFGLLIRRLTILTRRT